MFCIAEMYSEKVGEMRILRLRLQIVNHPPWVQVSGVACRSPRSNAALTVISRLCHYPEQFTETETSRFNS
jgi:hypothetical protein